MSQIGQLRRGEFARGSRQKLMVDLIYALFALAKRGKRNPRSLETKVANAKYSGAYRANAVCKVTRVPNFTFLFQRETTFGPPSECGGHDEARKRRAELSSPRAAAVPQHISAVPCVGRKRTKVCILVAIRCKFFGCRGQKFGSDFMDMGPTKQLYDLGRVSSHPFTPSRPRVALRV